MSSTDPGPEKKTMSYFVVALMIALFSLFLAYGLMGSTGRRLKVIYDSDNAMGIPGRDVDDGLGLLYLLGNEDVELLGVTTTHGNDRVQFTYENTKRILREMGREDVEVRMGGTRYHRHYEAAEFLVSQVNANVGEITIVAVRSQTNLYGAYMLDNEFLDKVKQIVIMGGITEPLIVFGQPMSELNLSVDFEASYNVLNPSASVTVITGNLCLEAFFGKQQFQRLEDEKEDIPIYGYISDVASPWRDRWIQWFGANGFHHWDVVACVYATNPELFTDNPQDVISTVKDLRTGKLVVGVDDSSAYTVNIPSSITDINRFDETVFQSWANVQYVNQSIED